MLGHWPSLYPEEILYSGCARYAERMGSPPHSYLRADLFGSARVGDIVDFPDHLRHLVNQIPGEFGVTSEDIIWNHTILPFFRPFLGSDLVSKIAEEMLTTRLENYGARLRGASAQPLFLRYCPCCAEEDRHRYKETYWHRSHQIGVVHACPIHLVLLNDSSMKRAHKTSYSFVSAEQAIPSTLTVKRIDPRSADAALLLWMAEQSQWLLNERHLSFTSGEIATRYLYQLNRSGLASYRSEFATKQVIRRLKGSIPFFSLPSYGLDDIKNKSVPLRSLLTRGRGQPSVHLHLLWMLGLSVKDFLSSCCEYFEDGPWPCLNPTGICLHANTIQSYRREVSQENRLFGVFSCHCGYTYSRSIPDREGISRCSPAKVLATGPAWESNLSRQWLTTRPLREIATSLKTSRANVVRVAERLGLSRTRNGRTLVPPTSLRLEVRRNESRLKYRDELRKCLETNLPSLPNAIVHQLAPNALNWLRRHDRDWLSSVMPPAKPPVRRVNWQARDVEISARVPAIVDSLLRAPGVPRRITTNRIILALDFSGERPSPNRLRRTAAVIKTSSESLQDCAIRRLHWFVSNAEASGQQWNFSRLLKISQIKKSWLNEQKIIRAIVIASERININHIPSSILIDHQVSSMAEDEAA